MRPQARISALEDALRIFYNIAKDACLESDEPDEMAFYMVGEFVVTWGDMRKIIRVMEDSNTGE